VSRDLEAELKSEREARIRAQERVKELSLDVIQFWRVVFGVDWVHTAPGETPMQLAERARQRIAEISK
jgi:hypothetical protein